MVRGVVAGWDQQLAFDPLEAFTKLFVPYGDDYLYYPSRKSGGKLVTRAEYQSLVDAWRSVVGPRGRWKIVGLVIAAAIAEVAARDFFDLPSWFENVVSWLIAIAVIARILWPTFAPRRLVRGRADVTPRRVVNEARRDARSLLPWRMVLAVMVFSGLIFLTSLVNRALTLSGWLWLIGSGGMFGLYVWIGIQKIRDQRRPK